MFSNHTYQYQYNKYHFICDTKSDIDDLPTQAHEVDGYHTPTYGSTAFVIDGTLCYIYGNDNEWHEI